MDNLTYGRFAKDILPTINFAEKTIAANEQTVYRNTVGITRMSRDKSVVK